MSTEYPDIEFTPDALVVQVPAFLESLWLLESRDPAILDAAFLEAGLVYSAKRARHRRPDSRAFHLALAEEPAPTFERRLRAAVTKVLGKPAGSDKHWDLGCHIAVITVVNRTLGIHLRPRFSVRELRDAAADWLAGTSPEAWLASHGLDAPDTQSSVHGTRVRIYGESPGSLHAGLFIEPGARPPLARPTSDDENLELTLHYLADGLGTPEATGLWRRGARSFSFHRMRSRTRSISFVQDASA